MKSGLSKIYKDSREKKDSQEKYLSSDEVKLFAKNQFLRLIKKNLQIPVSIIHL